MKIVDLLSESMHIHANNTKVLGYIHVLYEYELRIWEGVRECELIKFCCYKTIQKCQTDRQRDRF